MTARALHPVARRLVVGRPGRRFHRSADDRSYLFLLNHTDAERVVELGGIQGFELLGCSEVSDRITLDPLGVAVLRER